MMYILVKSINSVIGNAKGPIINEETGNVLLFSSLKDAEKWCMDRGYGKSNSPKEIVYRKYDEITSSFIYIKKCEPYGGK